MVFTTAGSVRRHMAVHQVSQTYLLRTGVSGNSHEFIRQKGIPAHPCVDMGNTVGSKDVFYLILPHSVLVVPSKSIKEIEFHYFILIQKQVGNDSEQN